MWRYASAGVLAYDADSAGLKAALRAIGLVEKTGLDVRVLRLTGAKDPDEFIRKFGRDAFQTLLERSERHVEYRLLGIKNKHSLDTDEGRIKYLAEATELLAAIPNAVEREIYCATAAEAAGVSAEAVKNEVKKAFKKRLSGEKKRQDRKEHSAAVNMQPGDRTIRYDNVYSAAAEEGVVHLLIQDDTLMEAAERLGFTDEEFTSPFLQKIYRIVRRRRAEALEIAPAAVLSELDRPEAAQLTRILQRPQSLANAETAMRDYIEKIRTERLKRMPGKTPWRFYTNTENRVVEETKWKRRRSMAPRPCDEKTREQYVPRQLSALIEEGKKRGKLSAKRFSTSQEI
jgi:DNA primase